MKIEILGTGCKKCSDLFENTKNAVAKKGIFAQVLKVEDINTIMEYGVINTPALVIDGVVKASGKVLSQDDILKLFV